MPKFQKVCGEITKKSNHFNAIKCLFFFLSILSHSGSPTLAYSSRISRARGLLCWPTRRVFEKFLGDADGAGLGTVL